MNKQPGHSGVNFTQPMPNYPLLGFAAVVIICLIAGLIMAFAEQNWVLTLIFLFSVGGIAVFSYWHLHESKKFAVGENNKNLEWEISVPDYQRGKLNTEVRELARILDIGDEQISDLLSAYIVAEDLALRQIQQEAKLPLVRHVSLADIPFDAILVKKELITCIEVSFLVSPSVAQEKINVILSKAAALKKAFQQNQLDSKIRLLLVIVTQFDQQGEAELRSTIKDKFASTPVDADIRLLDFETLQKTYAME